MMRNIGYFEVSAYLSSGYECVQQSLFTTAVKLHEIRQNPDTFQKILIVVRSVIQGINAYYHKRYLPHLIAVLNLTESFDFYGFCRLPRYVFYSYTPERIDEYAVLDRLEVTLCTNWNLGQLDDKGEHRDPAVHQFAKTQFHQFLEQMVENDQALRTEQELKTLLHNWFSDILTKNPKPSYDLHLLDLNGLTIPLKKTSWLELGTDSTFVLIDVVCVPSFLNEWGLLNLSHYAHQIGRLPFLSWVPHQTLDNWIWKFMVVGFALQFSQALQTWYKGKETVEEIKNARWQMAASAADCLYCLAILQKVDTRLIIFLAFTAKSLGIIQFLCAPKPSFFT